MDGLFIDDNSDDRHPAKLGLAGHVLFDRLELGADEVAELSTEALAQLEGLICPVRLRLFFKLIGTAAPLEVLKIHFDTQ